MPKPAALEMYPSLGVNTAVNVSQLAPGAQRRAYDACMRSVNTIGKRPGSAPVTSTALDDPISYLTVYAYPNEVEVGVAPTLAAVEDTTSTLDEDTYYVRYTYVTDNGETEASPEASQEIAAGEALQVTVPAIPYHANSINIYVGTEANAETLQLNTTELVSVFAELITDGDSYPAINTTRFREELLAVSGDTLYGYYNGELQPAVMTDVLSSPDVYTVPFTDSSASSVLLIADGGSLKYYDGYEVKEVTPAANDTDPLPPNNLTTINALGIKYVWSYSDFVFVSTGGRSLFYSKRYSYRYFPSVREEIYVRGNDYFTGPGIAFANVMLIPMRRNWAVLLGTQFAEPSATDPFVGGRYLNTIDGNISPRGYTKITYPTGGQTIAYLSDDGVYEIFDTGFIDTGVRQYSTRSLMKDKLDFNEYGFTIAEKESAVMWFDSTTSWMLLKIRRADEFWVFKFDTRNQEWYGPWRFPWDVTAFEKWDGINYFAGDTGLLHVLNEDLYSDWDDKEKTTGTPIDFDVYSGLLSFEFTGEGSYLHRYIIESQQWKVKSTLDVAIIYGNGITNLPSALKNEIFVWDVSGWDDAQWANFDFTDVVNGAKSLVIHRKSKYFQRRWRNNRDEPTLILREAFKGTISNVSGRR